RDPGARSDGAGQAVERAAGRRSRAAGAPRPRPVEANTMLSPKRTKYRKAHKGRIHGVAKGGTTLNFGAFGLKAVEPGRVTARQIEAARRTITRTMRRVGRVWIRIFPDVPVSSKPAEVRMGSGKGSPEFWVCRVKPGRIMFELDGVDPDVAREAFELAAAKLPVATRFVQRAGEEVA